jgi:exopolysaccharide biosynthesis polyprenyl glycosylphosphotransferase
MFQLLTDMAAALSGFFLATVVYGGTRLVDEYKNYPHHPEPANYIQIAFGFTALMVLFFAVKHLYQTRETGLMNMDEAAGVLQGLFGAALATAAYVGLAREEFVSRLVVLLALVFSFILVLAGRAFGYKLRRYLQKRGHFCRRVILCGAGEAGRLVARRLLQSPKFHILPVAFLDDDPQKHDQEIKFLTEQAPLPVVGSLNMCAEVLAHYDAAEVWITMPGAKSEVIENILAAAEKAGAACRFVPNLFRLPLERLSVDNVGGLPLLAIKPRSAVRRFPLTKRVFDVTFSVLVLLAGLPLWPLIMLLVKLSSPGPLFFTQERVGQSGRLFRMYKFRTMFSDLSGQSPSRKRPDDPRVTPIGRWLRKLSVDELPQFWNVLKGDMSVVGPRPEMPHIVAQYNEIQRQRLAVRPGITGLWQISVDRKNPIHENIDYDLYYIENQSFFMDLMIILTTGVYGARGA